MQTSVGNLSPRELELFKAGIEVGRCYWDGYYGSTEDIVKMLGDDEIVSYTDGETLGV